MFACANVSLSPGPVVVPVGEGRGVGGRAGLDGRAQWGRETEDGCESPYGMLS